MKHYNREKAPYELDEIAFILWNIRCWGSDDKAVRDIAALVGRAPQSVRCLYRGG